MRTVEREQIMGFSDGIIYVRIDDREPELGERFLIHKELRACQGCIYSPSGIVKVIRIDKVLVTERKAKKIIKRETYWLVDMEASLEDPCDTEHMEEIAT